VGLVRAARDLLGRAGEWRTRSISNQITAAAVTLNLGVAAVLGLSTFVAVRSLVARDIESSLEGQGRLVEQRLAFDLRLAAKDLADLAGNSFIGNGLVDSAGRDTYLLPFLREHHHPVLPGAGLLLCDFKGAPVAANDPTALELVGRIRGVGRALSSARPGAEVLSSGGATLLVLTHPVVFPPTGQVEGVVVARLDLRELLSGATAFLGADGEVQLAIDGITLDVSKGGGGPMAASVTRRPSLPAVLAGMDVTLRVGTHADVYAPLRGVGFLFLLMAIATIVVVVRSSRAIARRLAAPIEELSRVAGRITAGGELELPGPVGGSSEVAALASALGDMLGKLRASQEGLEQRVRERTAELQGRERELQRLAETQAVLLREVNHRVKNNLAAIISVLHLEETLVRAGDDGKVTAILEEMESRIRSLATVHALLSGAEWQPLPLEDLCLRLLRTTLGTGKGGSPELRVSASPVRIDSGQAHHLALVLNELATNTLKHGRPEGQPPRVEVGISTEGQDVTLTYRDHGPGFPPAALGLEPGAIGTGLQLVRGIVETSLAGALSLSNDGGAVTTLRFARLTQAPGDQP
jgi:two-component sensor histidine kinase/HAMP domain-containing protein